MVLAPFRIDEKTFFKQHFTLPPLSSTLLGILEIVQSNTAGAAEVTEVVSRDAVMATHLLKVVNSAYYALPKKIASIQHAITYLGLGEVSRICMALSVINSLKPADYKELRYFWFHSYLTALIAKRVVQGFSRVADVGELYSAALLHDLGQLIYQKFFPDHFRRMRTFCITEGRFLVDAEEQFGFPSHLSMGALLCDHWGLPGTIKRACSFHELRDLKTIPNKSDAEPFDIVITVSNLIAALATAKLNPQLKEEVASEIRRILQTSKEELLKFLADIYELERKAEITISQMI
jgi:HD-like signal output (HDOD) protein